MTTAAIAFEQLAPFCACGAALPVPSVPDEHPRVLVCARCGGTVLAVCWRRQDVDGWARAVGRAALERHCRALGIPMPPYSQEGEGA
jgi:hypothetical protein